MEFPHVGLQCQVDSCNQLDYLYYKCSGCHKILCHLHHLSANHDCPNPPIKDEYVICCPLCRAPLPGKKDEDPYFFSPHAHVNNLLCWCGAPRNVGSAQWRPDVHRHRKPQQDHSGDQLIRHRICSRCPDVRQHLDLSVNQFHRADRQHHNGSHPLLHHVAGYRIRWPSHTATQFAWVPFGGHERLVVCRFGYVYGVELQQPLLGHEQQQHGHRVQNSHHWHGRWHGVF